MKNGVSPGFDGLNVEHYKYTGERLGVLLSLVYAACMVHRHLPNEVMDSITVPVAKDHKG